MCLLSGQFRSEAELQPAPMVTAVEITPAASVRPPAGVTVAQVGVYSTTRLAPGPNWPPPVGTRTDVESVATPPIPAAKSLASRNPTQRSGPSTLDRSVIASARVA